MIMVKENTSYEIGFELARIVAQVRSVKADFDNADEVDREAISTKIDNILDGLEKMHNWMAEE